MRYDLWLGLRHLFAKRRERFVSVIALIWMVGLLVGPSAITWAGIPPASQPGMPVNGLQMELELPPSQHRLRVGERADARLVFKNVGSRPLILQQDWALDLQKGWSTGDPFHLVVFVYDADGRPRRPPLLSSSLNAVLYDRGRDAFVQLEPGGQFERVLPITIQVKDPGLYGLEVTVQMTSELYAGRLGPEVLTKAWTGRVASNRVIIEVAGTE